ncbi:BRO family protein, partial [uncultured Clostridium sp.]|uniref:BRO family protein n=1 Tax=uncultured Clostridium sp. TaxID=59620 RepID=UPI00260E7732
MMNDLIRKKFKNKSVFSFVWNGKVCWIGSEIGKMFGYAQPRNGIYDCIRREKFEVGLEYDLLEGEELKEFKEIFSDVLEDFKFAPKIIVLYETGLYGFLGYTEMPLGVEFRAWIRKEVMPVIKEKGYSVKEEIILSSDNVQNNVAVNDFSFSKFSTEKMERYRLAFESAKM